MRGAIVRVEGVFDPLAGEVVPAVDAVSIDAFQDMHAVAARAATSAGAEVAFSHKDKASSRRSYGRRASGVAANSGSKAISRAARQIRP